MRALIIGFIGTTALFAAGVTWFASLSSEASNQSDGGSSPQQERSRPDQRDTSQIADNRNEEPDPTPKAIEWHGHYLILQGENFLPVERGFATPNITVFEVEDGYTPSGKATLETQIEGCDPAQKPAQSVLDTGESSATLKAEAAVDYASAATIRAQNRQYCPERLGKTYGSGSYVYDEAFNQLAGQDFEEGTDHWLGVRLHDDPVDSEEIIIIGQGGSGRENDPALEIYNYDNGMIVDLLFDPDTYNGKQEPGLGESGPAPAPELPVKITGHLWNKLPFEEQEKELIDVGEISEELDEALKAATERAVEKFDALIISRGATSANFDVAEARLDAIADTARERLGPSAQVTTISLGVAAPICDDDDPACWVLNRSTLLYLRPR